MKRFLLTLACLGLLWGSGWAATSKQYTAPETAITIGDSAQTPTVTITFSALASGAGRISAQYDRGAGSKAGLYDWNCTVQLTGTNVVGATIEWYVARSNGTNVIGQVGTTDAALTTDKRNNLDLIGLTVVDQTTTNTSMTAGGTVFIPGRYFSLGIWNATSLPLKTDTAVHKCTFIPTPFEMQ